MSDFLIRYGSILEPQDELCSDEAVALARIVELYEAGEKASLWQELPVKLTAKARIVRRKGPALESVVVPPSPAIIPGAGESVCAALGCSDPVAEGPFCRAHFVGGVSPETAAKLRKSKGEPRAAAPMVPRG